MKKKLFTMLALLCLTATGAWADELTVHDGTTTNQYVPIYGDYCDAYLKCEMVMPATELSAMNGSEISAMTFYSSATNVSWGNASFQVFLKEVSEATIGGFSGPGTVVYEGALSIVAGEMTVTFTTPYTYNGGNLLIGVYNTATGSYVQSNWYGVSGASVQGHNYNALADVMPNQRNFLPKTTFTYAAAAPAGPEVTWNAATKTGTFAMPGYDVELEVAYFNITAPTANTTDGDIHAGTATPLINAASTTEEGATIKYLVTATSERPTSTDGFSADVPTAEAITAPGTYYVWYYLDFATGDDSDISAQAIEVTVADYLDYTISLAKGTEDAGKWDIVPTEAKPGTEIKATYSGTKRVKSVKAVKKAPAPSYPLLSAVTTSDYGKVVCAAGHLHDAKTAVPDGCTAVGIIGKVTETGHGLILALQDAAQQNWNTINGWTSASYAGTTLKVLPDDAARGSLTSYTTLGETTVSNWAVAQKSDYEAIFINLGSTKGDSDGTTYDDNVNAYITTGVGGTAISDYNWSATSTGTGTAWYFRSSYWDGSANSASYSVRPVLGF